MKTMRQRSDAATLERIKTTARVDDATGCWIWRGTKSKSGYPIIKYRGKPVRVHRLVCVLIKHESIEGLVVCHRCDVPLCVNPDHLFLGTHADNMADRDSKGRQAKGDGHGARIHREAFALRAKMRAVEQPNSYCRGERNGRAKLTAAQADAIRADHANGLGSYRVLAMKYNVSRASIARIIQNRGWANHEAR